MEAWARGRGEEGAECERPGGESIGLGIDGAHEGVGERVQGTCELLTSTDGSPIAEQGGAGHLGDLVWDSGATFWGFGKQANWT